MEKGKLACLHGHVEVYVMWLTEFFFCGENFFFVVVDTQAYVRTALKRVSKACLTNKLSRVSFIENPAMRKKEENLSLLKKNISVSRAINQQIVFLSSILECFLNFGIEISRENKFAAGKTSKMSSLVSKYTVFCTLNLLSRKENNV